MARGRELVVLDASVLVAAAHSPLGGLALALEVCRSVRSCAALTLRIIAEARKNIATKLGEGDLLRFYRQLADLDPEVVRPPSAAHMARCASLTAAKDVHVLATALACDATCVLTLDRRDLLTAQVQAAGLPFRVMTPGDFLRWLAGEA